MQKQVLLVLIGNRQQSAIKVQEILTESGCLIKTRLGLHEAAGDACSNSGLVILELMGAAADTKALEGKLNAIANVTAKLVEIAVE